MLFSTGDTSPESRAGLRKVVEQAVRVVCIQISRTEAVSERKRAALSCRRARAAAQAVGGPQDSHGVPAGTYVLVHVTRVPSAAAAAVVARVAASLQVLFRTQRSASVDLEQCFRTPFNRTDLKS